MCNAIARKALISTAAATVGLMTAGAFGATQTWYLDATEDTYVDSNAGDTNNGGDSELYVGDGNQNGKVCRSYMKFDLCSLKDEDIESAKLKVYVTGYGPSAGLGVDCHEMLMSWSEYTVDWNDGVTYRTTAESQDWINGSGQWFEWDVTSLVWAEQDDDGKFSLMLMAVNEQPSTYSDYIHFYSRSNEGYEPYVEIVYTPGTIPDGYSWDLAIPDPGAVSIRNPFDGIEGTTLVLEPPPVGWATPTASLVGPGGSLYTSDQTSGMVFIHDTDGGYLGELASPADGVEFPRGFDVQCGLFGIACGLDWASPASVGRVMLFDGPHSYVGDLFTGGCDPYDIRWLPGRRALVSDNQPGGGVRLYEADGGSNVLLFPLPAPRQIATMHSTGHYLVASYGGGPLTEFDEAGTIYRSWPIGPSRGVFEAGNGRILVTRDDGLWSFDPDNPVDFVLLDGDLTEMIEAIPNLGGACCFDGGSCDDLIQTDCVALSGAWQGFETFCESFTCPTAADSFVLQGHAVPGLHYSDAQWGDVDADGDLDLAVCGQKDDGTAVTHTYENQGGTLVLRDELDGVTNTGSGCMAWGDYDADGDLDLAVAGINVAVRIARVYENDGTGHLSWDPAQVLTPVNGASVAWGDYDLDGDLDLVIVGYDGVNRLATLYENTAGLLAAAPTQPLTGMSGGSADWADWDGDGDPDLLLTGHDGKNRRTIFYENDPPGTLTDTGAHGLPGLTLSDAAFGDYDADGDLDLAVTGESGTGGPQHARVYENDGAGVFTQLTEVMNIYRSSCAWGDWDNDGRLDVAFSGNTGTSLRTRIYRNTGSGFTMTFNLPGRYDGSVSWADVDGDDDLDFLVTGFDWSNGYTELHEKRGGYVNSPPSAPTALSSDQTGGALHLAWSGGSDRETPVAGLYHALRVGTASGGHDVASGTFGTPLMGNRGQAVALDLDVPEGSYYWSVRSIDAGFAASPWAPEVIARGDAPSCYGDVDHSGAVGFSDVLMILTGWGPCEGCIEDLDEDGDVGFSDLLDVLTSWGPC